MMSIIEHFSDFLWGRGKGGGGGEREHLSGNNGPLRWGILVKKQVHDEQKPIVSLSILL